MFCTRIKQLMHRQTHSYISTFSTQTLSFPNPSIPHPQPYIVLPVVVKEFDEFLRVSYFIERNWRLK